MSEGNFCLGSPLVIIIKFCVLLILINIHYKTETSAIHLLELYQFIGIHRAAK